MVESGLSGSPACKKWILFIPERWGFSVLDQCSLPFSNLRAYLSSTEQSALQKLGLYPHTLDFSPHRARVVLPRMVSSVSVLVFIPSPVRGNISVPFGIFRWVIIRPLSILFVRGTFLSDEGSGGLVTATKCQRDWRWGCWIRRSSPVGGERNRLCSGCGGDLRNGRIMGSSTLFARWNMNFWMNCSSWSRHSCFLLPTNGAKML